MVANTIAMSIHTPIEKSVLTILLGVSLLATPACNTSKAVKGGAIGATAGAGAGAVIGNQLGDNGTVWGALIGAAVGGTAGTLIGRKMDKQAEELREDLKGAEVTRVGEGIKITFDSGLLFASGKSDLNSAAQSNLTELAQTLNKYPDTEVLIEGHTDSDGSDELNLRLSKDRAESVERYLSRSVQASRFTTMGYGEGQPVADNGSADGKAKNRRVEVAIYANTRMVKAAERGELE